MLVKASFAVFWLTLNGLLTLGLNWNQTRIIHIIMALGIMVLGEYPSMFRKIMKVAVGQSELKSYLQRITKSMILM